MTETNRELDAAWQQLEDALATQLASMTDPDEADHLRIEIASADEEHGCAPYAQFAGFGDGRMLRAEVSGNAYLMPQYAVDGLGAAWWESRGWAGNDEDEKNWYVERPLHECAEIAHDVISGLRAVFGIAHPDLLTYAAWGPAADGAELLGLLATDDIPIDEPTPPQKLPKLAKKPKDRDALVRLVEKSLRDIFEEEPTRDDDGDFVLLHSDTLVWVRVLHDQPAVQIMARVVRNVRSRRATSVELGLLNRDNVWSRWVLRDRDVWQVVTISAMPYAHLQLQAMIALFFEAMDTTTADLALRVNGRVT